MKTKVTGGRHDIGKPIIDMVTKEVGVIADVEGQDFIIRFGEELRRVHCTKVKRVMDGEK